MLAYRTLIWAQCESFKLLCGKQVVLSKYVHKYGTNLLFDKFGCGMPKFVFILPFSTHRNLFVLKDRFLTAQEPKCDSQK